MILHIFLFVLMVQPFFITINTTSYAEVVNDCLIQLLGTPYSPKRIQISDEQYHKIFGQINETMEGNLSTVFRIEAKAKGTFNEASTFLQNVVKSQEGISEELATLPVTSDLGYIKKIEETIRKTTDGQIGRLGTRDPPIPSGVTDKTFTYYTASLATESGAKHQMRLRRYIRNLDLKEMVPGDPVRVFTEDGVMIFEKLKNGQIKITTGKSFEKDGSILNGQIETLTQKKVLEKFDNKLSFYAYPHGKGYKFEIKSKLDEEISDEVYENLAGKNYVQKLDVSFEFKHIDLLFNNPIKNREDLLTRLNQVKEDLYKNPKYPEGSVGRKRVDLYMDFLKNNYDLDPGFFKLEGATEYSRKSFTYELPDQVGGKNAVAQMTFDYNMGTRSVYDQNGRLLTPTEAYHQSPLKSPADSNEEVHFEFKLAKELIKKATEKESADGSNAVSPELKNLLTQFTKCNVTNRGKFCHIEKQKGILDKKETD